MQHGMHDRLLELLADALASHGCTTTRNAALEGRSGTVYTIPLLAEGPPGAIIVDVQVDDPLPAAAVDDMADVLHDVGADVALLCHLGAVEAGASVDGVTLWGFDHLIHFIGESLVCQATGIEPQPLAFAPAARPVSEPLAESLSEVLPAAFQTAPAVADAWESGFPMDLDALEQMPGLDFLSGTESATGSSTRPAAAPTIGSPTAAGEPNAASGAQPGPSVARADDAARGVAGPPPAWDAPGPASSPAWDAPEVEPAPRYAHPLLPIRITPDEARLRVRGLLRADHVQMVLQPVHLIDYECDLLVEGSLRYDTVSGRVQVHGTDKAVTEVDAMAVDAQGFTRLPDVPRLPSHERTLRVSDARATQCAADHLLGAHTRIVEVEVDEPDLGFAYTEKKKVAPRPDHVRLNPLGTFHRVLWRLVGSAGHVDVDALTGDVVEEVLHNPRHDSIIID